MKQLLTYIRLSDFLFYSLLQICNDLFRIIFSYQLKNGDRYMQQDQKKNIQNKSKKLNRQHKQKQSIFGLIGQNSNYK
ncbi:unnamed protein product [Paramecium primaurelia]|uniref:Uncharacterized protein n=1 Tax=Paramecium primaurelia TaxID=5886 RepID=A0A8S1QS35_PARPR|nr:unnamed protein product [Paramecium primaurelia]